MSRRHPRAFVAPVLIPIVLLASAPRAGAAAYEGFNYPTNPTTPLNGGTGFLGAWPGGSPVAAGSLTNPGGTLATSGNRVDVGVGFIERRLADVIGTPGTDVWMSWLQRPTTNLPGFQGVLLAQPTGPGSWTGTYYIGEPGSGPGNGTYVIGKGGDDLNVVSSGVPLVANEPVFLVTHFQFREGNDLATLYVNPAPGTTPTGGVTYSGLDMPVVNPIISLQGSGQGPTSFDELRIGSTFAEVAPLVPEPSAAALAASAACVALLRRGRR